jgi:hypothetical protein
VKRALLTLCVGVAWYTWGAPAAAERLKAERTEATAHLSYVELKAAAIGQELDDEEVADFRAAERAARRETDWEYVMAALLTPAERAEGLARAAAMPPVPANGLLLTEPEVPVLLQAIHHRYGHRTAPVPPVPIADPWATIDRRTRVRAAIALVEGPGLDPDRAAILLAATLDLLAAQQERSELEDALAARLVPVGKPGKSDRR